MYATLPYKVQSLYNIHHNNTAPKLFYHGIFAKELQGNDHVMVIFQ